MLDSTDDWVDRTSGYDFGSALADRDPALRRWVMASPRRALATDFGRLAVARLGDARWPAPLPGKPRLYRVDLVEAHAAGASLLFPQGARVARVGIVDGLLELDVELEASLAEQLEVDTEVLLRFSPATLRASNAGLEGCQQRVFVARLCAWLEQSGVSTPETRRRLALARAEQLARSARHEHDAQRGAAAVRHMIRVSPRLGRLGALDDVLVRTVANAGLAAHTDEIRRIALPCYTLVPSAGGLRARVGESRLGGLPDLPATMLWPRVDGAPLGFLAQLDLASLPTLPECPLPRTGLLSFFLGDSESSTDVEHRVLYSDDPAALVRARRAVGVPWRDDSAGLLDPVRVAIQAAISLPGYASRLPRQLGFAGDDALMERYHELASDLGGVLEHGKSLVLGHADGDELDDVLDAYAAQRRRPSPRYLARASIEDDVAQAEEAGDRLRGLRARERLATYEWWQEHAGRVAVESHDWRLLLSLNSHAEAGMCFGDAGTLNVYIHEDDLRARRFDRTRATIVTA